MNKALNEKSQQSGADQDARSDEANRKENSKPLPSILKEGADTDGAGTGGMTSGKDAGGGPAGCGGTSGAG